ncbi:MAG TPA: excinuclease ABC subunit A, partial [Prosthecobacter sp.]
MPRAAKKSAPRHAEDVIRIRGARQNNLKGVDLDLPLGKLSVITGPSGSGKSSLAFDTIYAEGQRRYVETFSPYTRQFFERMDKPKVDSIEGIPPAIAIEQVNNMRSTRSTVGTITEINDYLKMIFPRLAEATCPSCQRLVRPESPESIVRELLGSFAGKQALIMFPIGVPKNSDATDFATFLQAQGFVRVWLYGNVIRLDDADALKGRKLPAQVMVVQDRVALEEQQRARLSEAIEAALRYGKGKIAVNIGEDTRHFSTDWSCADCGITLPTPTPGLFSFNSPIGACPTCRGFGRTLGIDLGKAIPDESLSINEGLVRPFQSSSHGESQLDLERTARKRGIDIHKPFEDYTADERRWLLEGTRDDPEEAHNRGEWYGVR